MTIQEKVALVQENVELLPAHNKEFAGGAPDPLPDRSCGFCRWLWVIRMKMT